MVEVYFAQDSLLVFYRKPTGTLIEIGFTPLVWGQWLVTLGCIVCAHIPTVI